jgi:outer membrane receptor protein involved in Fe transport
MHALAPTVVSTQLVNLHNNSVISGSNTAALNGLNGNGYLTTNDNSSYHTDYHDIFNDMRATWNWADRNSLTVGWLFEYVPADNIIEQGNDFLVDVKNHPNVYNIQGLNAAGAVVANYTDQGVSQYGGNFYSDGSLKTVSNSIYINDEINVTKELKLDGGFRREFIDMQLTQEGYNFGAALPAAVAAANPLPNVAISNGIGSSGNGQFATTQNSVDDKAFTFGANYRIGEHFAVYARTGSSYDTGVQDFDVFLGSLPKDNNGFQSLRFNEVGVRFDSSYLAATVTGFTGKNTNIALGVQPVGGAPTNIFYNNKSEGLEFEATWSPIHALSVDLSGVIQKATIDGVPSGVAIAKFGLASSSQFNGNQIDRLPNVQVHFQPTFHFNRRGSVYVSVDYVGPRWGDLANTQRLNAYTMIGAGVSYRVLKNLTLGLSGTNLTNVLAFDVGNPRGGGNISLIQGAVFSRALLGRQAQFTGTLNF